MSETFRLLARDEVINRGDQVLHDGCEKWTDLVGWEVGLPYNPCMMVPVRRRTERAVPIDGDGRTPDEVAAMWSARGQPK